MVDTAAEHGVRSALERSRSGEGGHVRILSQRRSPPTRHGALIRIQTCLWRHQGLVDLFRNVARRVVTEWTRRAPRKCAALSLWLRQRPETCFLQEVRIPQDREKPSDLQDFSIGKAHTGFEPVPPP